MKKTPYLALLLALAACATTKDVPRPATLLSLDAEIEREIAGGSVPSLAYAITKDGRIVYERAFGAADRERGLEATVNTPYPLASTTKPLVATALMALVERGRVDLDVPALQYLPGWRAEGDGPQQYTVRQLLNHTSGLGTYASIAWGAEAARPADLAARFRHYGSPAHPPGTVSEYSNLGYGLVGRIVAEQSGQSLASFMEAALFRPLGMRNTMKIEGPNVPASAAAKYDHEGKRLPDTCNDTPGAGNIYASVHDLALFGIFHLGDDHPEIVSAAGRRLMHSYVEPGALYPYYDSSRYGLGWYFRNDESRSVVWHEGGMPGASTMLVLLPERGVSVAVAINANDRNDLAQKVANALIGIVAHSGPFPFDATAGFTRYAAEPGFRGRWLGSVEVDGQALPCTLTFADGGSVTVEFPGRAADDLLPARSTIRPLLNGDLLVATLEGTLPARDVAQERGGYVLLRLLRHGTTLSGTMVAYASPEGLRYLYPFHARFEKAPPGTD